jgi:hypothetical protein
MVANSSHNKYLPFVAFALRHLLYIELLQVVEKMIQTISLMQYEYMNKILDFKIPETSKVNVKEENIYTEMKF